MVLNQLKQIRDELKSSAKSYDTAFKNTALIAASELATKQTQLEQTPITPIVNNRQQTKLNPNLILNKEYFIANYGSLKNAKAAYQKLYGKQKFGRSWSDFITVAQKLASASHESKTLTIEDRITKIENFLISLGYQP
ncbi:MAG: hypothetical protein AAF383_28170 [Cyanobacteria bacterium P01_A01_bin.83]